MARFTGFDEVYSALYVDFDNIYTRFLEADPEAARAFGTQAILCAIDAKAVPGNPNKWEVYVLSLIHI